MAETRQRSIGNGGASESAGDPVGTLARLRALVGYLGERDQCGWWPTFFLSPTGRRYLAYNFPRTTLSAAVQAATYAAMRLHDQRIGRQGAFHLFRLPYGVEKNVHARLCGPDAAALAELIEGPERALAELGAEAGEEGANGVGPLRVSKTARMLHRPSLRKVAAVYHRAFGEGVQSFPYYTRE